MRYRRLATLAAVTLTLIASAAGAARVEESLAALRAKPDPGDRFMFVVVSDTHSAQSPIRTPAVRATMKEISLLRPELVVASGDLIHGAAIGELRQEWEECLSDTALCGAPFFPAAGNHDIAGPETEALWAEINGPMRYSFDRGECHFVILNSMERGGVWNDASMAWLKADLAASRAQHVFVFLHHPLWESEPARWRTVHEVLRAHPVRFVIAGHWHNYRKFDPVDGIQYVVMQSTGQTYEPGGDDPAVGRIGGYLMVRVDGEQVSYVVVRQGNIFPPEVCLQSDMTERERIAKEVFEPPVIDFPFGSAVDATVQLRIKNPYPRALSSSVKWQVPNANWKIAPLSRDYQVPAEGEASIPFRVSVTKPAAAMYPTPTFSTTYRYGPEQEKSLTLEGEMELRPSFPALRAKQAITIEGKLDEWKNVPAMPCRYPTRIEITDTENLSAKAQFQYDERFLYLAVTVQDNEFYQPYTNDGIWQADSLQMFFDPKADGNDRAHHEDDYEYGMARTSVGLQAWVWRNPSRYEGPAPDIQLAIERTGKFTIYEAAFPAERLDPAALRAGNSIGYNLAVNDRDGPVAGKRHWWIDLMPGAGGGNPPFPMVRLELR